MVCVLITSQGFQEREWKRTAGSSQKFTDALREHMIQANVSRDNDRAAFKLQRMPILLLAVVTQMHLRGCDLGLCAEHHHTPPCKRSRCGALYFKVPRRILIFGVAAEAVPLKVNYLF